MNDVAKPEADGTVKKPKKCPSCGEAVLRLNLSAIPMPIEQTTIPWLRMTNKETHWSVRTFAQSSLDEMQFLCFHNNCPSCGLISWWDLGVEELEATLADPTIVPAISWNSSPKNLETLIQKLPDPFKGVFQPLLDTVKTNES